MRTEDVAENTAGPKPYLVVIPVFNDWEVLRKLLPQLDAALGKHRLEADVLIVDDGSTRAPGEGWLGGAFGALRRVDVLRLRRNMGHQRAIAISLAYVEEKVPCRAVIVMDGDGEDDPRDVPRLVARYRQEAEPKIIFAERARRSESWVFRAFYSLYKLLHLLLAGRPERVGNFSLIPAERLTSLVVVAETWNHYAAAVFKSRQPVAMIRTDRAKRLEGKSQMSFVGLVIHGLSALSVFAETVGVRLLVATSVLIVLTLAGIGGVVAVRLLTDLAIPGWATFTAAALLIMLLQAIMFSLLLAFFILNSRQASTFLPLRDYPYFVAGVRAVYRRREKA